MWNCKHCNKEFIDITNSEKGNHSRWCDLNPKRHEYKKSPGNIRTMAAMKEAREKNGNLNHFLKAKHNGTVYIMSDETRLKIGTASKGRKHTPESKQKISDAGRNSKHRRLRKNVIKYIKTDGSLVTLDSTWEYYLASKLDNLNVVWIRPDPIEWVDDDLKIRHYFPDFYLPERNLYLDPKNPYAYNSQQEKITKILKLLPNLIIMKSIIEIDLFLETL